MLTIQPLYLEGLLLEALCLEEAGDRGILRLGDGGEDRIRHLKIFPYYSRLPVQTQIKDNACLDRVDIKVWRRLYDSFKEFFTQNPIYILNNAQKGVNSSWLLALYWCALRQLSLIFVTLIRTGYVFRSSLSVFSKEKHRSCRWNVIV